MVWVTPKIASTSLCKSNHNINYTSESGKSGKERKKLQKIEYTKNEKTILDKTKSIFHSFWRGVSGEKIKNNKHKF